MKSKSFVILASLLTISLFVGCSEDTVTEAVLGSNSVTISGDYSKSFDAITLAGLGTEDSTTVFTVLMRPKSADTYDEDIFSLIKLSDIIPPVGTYSIMDFNNVESGDGFVSSYYVNDSTMYLMNAGTIEITESSSSKVVGSFDVSGVLFEYAVTTPKEVTIKGKFSTIPVDMN
jgi:hypothetical protein